MGFKRKVDSNQSRLVSLIRRTGATVQHLHTIGKGCPDILVGFKGVNYLFEIKDGSKPTSSKKLTPDERSWHEAWRGSVYVIENIDDYLKITK